MSIRIEVANRLKEGSLFLVQPQTTTSPCVRTIFASEIVWNALSGPWNSVKDERRLGRARASLDNFIEGRLIAVRFPPSKSVEAFIAILDAPREEIWEIRVRDPNPGVRILGRFSEADVFIALLPIYREDLKTNRDWNDAKRRCHIEWRKLFPAENPHTGTHAHDYITNNIFLV